MGKNEPSGMVPLLHRQFHCTSSLDRGFAARPYPTAAKEASPTLTAIVHYPVENNTRQGVCRYIEENKSG